MITYKSERWSVIFEVIQTDKSGYTADRSDWFNPNLGAAYKCSVFNTISELKAVYFPQIKSGDFSSWLKSEFCWDCFTQVWFYATTTTIQIRNQNRENQVYCASQPVSQVDRQAG